LSRLTLALSALLLCGALTGCVTSPALQPTATDMKPENIRVLIAKRLLQTPAFGSISLIKAKIINARISPPSERRSFLSGEPYTYYCVVAFIENPLFPLHQAAYGEVEVTEANGQRNIYVRSRQNIACNDSNSTPFPEIETLSLQRYEQSS
jgi:hypothetical protein